MFLRPYNSFQKLVFSAPFPPRRYALQSDAQQRSLTINKRASTINKRASIVNHSVNTACVQH